MLKEFKDFIMTGNVVEFAVAVIMAGAIGGVVKGFVDNIIMPIVGHFSGGMDFAELKIVLDEAVVNAEGTVTSAENAIMWGSWVNTIVNLLIVGFVMFLIVKAYNKSKKPVEEAPAAPAGPSQEELLAEIRDLLKK
ncbi:large conductance mechanosensitive channel protein MscL [Algibacter amylolyticus]|uniref:Large-conductance mechanosensitive channel n=1 Tax=Algibacter amylolyticus TaxID=1608400 RepID=A0A5M7BF06_9FLAO|nr:large conductance mechanosensitive channel protein MscL [Algibacter amylolyticus]KAA5827510.1 large conductance mechanosensitive channel protein MscL [Algibacter amylolyticus]MBB5266711.1 large conductance mechanosensitive channel [Algibacter amylolyticus]TSJ81755.1 large conductance mechanosensitive channel protein MscL [Algibacter amylolyticus]